ncbi:MAG: septum formation initiator family protein [Pseudomonadales bacterium]|nr:septum formation initiator family protein [Pseudomonadales bacterium]MBO6657160.1 septum formation initiator family protein [Pseudomonadales bacterium]MBO7005225.1 septum formation initiator family protein [Pseudomonadales bacterium]
MTPFRVFVVVLLLAICSLQVRLWTGQGSFAHVSGLSAQVKQRTAENEARRQRNAVLKAEIKDLKQGLDAVEDIARSELGLIKKGETFFLLVED